MIAGVGVTQFQAHGGGGTIRDDTGRFLILAHEKLNKINDLNTPSGPTIIVIYQ